jgi:DNA invertase Pin-like site-specific DNA recombinase
MELAGYIRVSTDQQAVEGLGLDVQRQAIKAWAKAAGHRLAGVHADEGVSGAKDLADRPGLGDALDAVRSGAVGGLVVYRLDRLARDLVLQEQLIAEVRRLGGVLFTTSAGEAGYLDDDPDDPSRKLIRRVLGAVNEYERSMIALRLRSGRRRKAERGGFAYGSPAYGFKATEGRELAPEPAEQAAISRALDLQAEGRSLRAIGDALLTEGHRPKRGDRWYPTTVARMLARAG